MRYLLASARPILADFAGTATFYLLYLATGSAALSAGVGLALGLAQIALHLWRRERVPALLLMGVALTLVLGGASLVAHSPRFLLLKPSIIYGVIGAAMLPRGWLARYAPEIARDLLAPEAFDGAGWAWAALMFATAALNIVLVATLAPKLAAGLFVAWAMGSKIVLFGIVYAVLRLHAGRAWRLRQAAEGSRSGAENAEEQARSA